jgi:hypothetical protein
MIATSPPQRLLAGTLGFESGRSATTAGESATETRVGAGVAAVFVGVGASGVAGEENS